MRSDRQRPIRFSVFELDPAAGELRKHGVLLKLQEKPLQALLALLEHPGEVLSREDLQKRLWQNGIHVDFDHGLNKAINRLTSRFGRQCRDPALHRNSASARLYLKGVFFLQAAGANRVEKSIEFFRQAIQLDAAASVAHGGLAEALCFSGIFGLRPSGEAYSEARTAALKAL